MVLISGTGFGEMKGKGERVLSNNRQTSVIGIEVLVYSTVLQLFKSYNTDLTLQDKVHINKKDGEGQ